jgi:predicted ABC-type ATPase
MDGELPLQIKALRDAESLGCFGAHQNSDGSWSPCQSFAEYKNAVAKINGVSRVNEDDLINWNSRRKKKGKKNKDKFEKLKEGGIIGIQTLPSGGLVSAPVGGSSGMVTASVSHNETSSKSIQSAFFPRDNDVDVFTDIESARKRSRQMGCIGVSRRISKNGKIVWMPCTNISDYSRLAGTTPLGRRHQKENLKRVVRTVLKDNSRKRKKSLTEELHEYKSIGKKIKNTARGLASRFDPNALDGDGDGLVQEGTAFERPAVPKPSTPSPVRNAGGKQRRGPSENWFHSMPEAEREMRFGPPIEEIGELDEKMRKAVDKAMSTPIRQDTGLRSTTAPTTSNPRATPNNPYAEIGGKGMGQIILGRVRPEHRNKQSQKTTYFVGGTSGAGKSDVLEKFLQASGIVPNDDEAAHVDPDFIKMGLNGYDDGRGASRVHGDSRAATDYVIKDAVSQGMDVIVQGTGKRTEHLKGAKRNGYRTVGHFVYASDQTATNRSNARNQRGGRQIPIFSSQIAREIPPYVSQAFRDGLLDEFYLWDNDVDSPDGNVKPKLIARKVPGKEMEVFDRNKFEDFAKGKKWADQWEQDANKNDKNISASSPAPSGIRSRTGRNSPNTDDSGLLTPQQYVRKMAVSVVPQTPQDLERMLNESAYIKQAKYSKRKIKKLIDMLQVDWEKQKLLTNEVEKALMDSPATVAMIQRFGSPPLLSTKSAPGESLWIPGRDIEAQPWEGIFTGVVAGVHVVPAGFIAYNPRVAQGRGFGAMTPAHVIRHEMAHGWHEEAKRKSKSAKKAYEKHTKNTIRKAKSFKKQMEKEGKSPSRSELMDAVSRLSLERNESIAAKKLSNYAATNISEYLAEALAFMTAPRKEGPPPIIPEHFEMLSEFLGMTVSELREIHSRGMPGDPFL